MVEYEDALEKDDVGGDDVDELLVLAGVGDEVVHRHLGRLPVLDVCQAGQHQIVVEGVWGKGEKSQ